MTSAPSDVLEQTPTAGDPAWQSFRDAAYNLMVTRARSHDEDTFGDGADRRLIMELAGLSPGEGHRAYHEAWISEFSYDLGRHVFAKPIVEDHLGEDLELLGELFERSGLGTLDPEAVFHRRADLSFAPGSLLADADRALLVAFVGGLVRGTLSEALNTPVTLTIDEGWTLSIELGAGRNVNQEAGRRG